jgi:glycerol-3-phosphate acyltransferase PlsY
MAIFLYISSAIVAYLISGVNMAIFLSKRLFHTDIRTVGSNNPGFTNFKRTFKSNWAYVILVFDLCKGAIPAYIFGLLFQKYLGLGQLGVAYTGLWAIFGHCFPIWYKFKGGKGFLTYTAVVWLLDWRVGIISFIFLLVLLLVTKYMSVATLSSMLVCPISLVILQSASWGVIVLCTLSVLFIVYRHKENIKRLFNGTENKFIAKKTS